MSSASAIGIADHVPIGLNLVRLLSVMGVARLVVRESSFHHHKLLEKRINDLACTRRQSTDRDP